LSNLQSVSFDVLRSITFNNISGTYAKVGAALAEPIRLVCFTNASDGDMFISDDGVNNKLFLAAGSFKLFDLATNHHAMENLWSLPVGTQFWVKQSSVPTKGAVYIECLWGQ
jgi:hypothetical protein